MRSLSNYLQLIYGPYKPRLLRDPANKILSLRNAGMRMLERREESKSY
uniref:Uncharacterized protein n=1 Tax=Anopheles quadriannulatus TaxID=34691 RepID=A0A182XTQ8_ANOQN